MQLVAENKETPHFTPQQLEIYIDEEKPGLIETNDTTRITVSDRDSVSKESLMCNNLMIRLDQSDLKIQFVPHSKHILCQ